MPVKFFYLSLFVCCMSNAALYGFATITQAESYAHTHPEDSRYTNKDQFNPDYNDVYQHYQPSFWRKALIALGLRKKEPQFNSAAFKDAISALTQQRELAGFIEQHVTLLPIKPQDKLIVFGELQGAFHSLVRDLAELVKLGLLDDDFHIKNPHYCMIFNADAIGRNPYNLETLSLIVSLMSKNPLQVFYIRGKYEDKNFWLKSTLMDQLVAIDEGSFEKKGSLAGLLSRFFDTLAVAAYVDYTSDAGQDLIRISGYDRNFFAIDEQSMGTFFNQSADHFERNYRIANLVPTVGKIQLRVLVAGMDGVTDFVKNNGIALRDPQAGATTWSVFSAPTVFHKNINKFYYDAFAIIDFADHLDKSTIVLYNRDLRTDEPFVARERYLLVSGETIDNALPAAKDVQVIKIGSTVDLTKSLSSEGKSIREGISACIEKHNKEAEQIEGKSLRVIILDDSYTPARARENVDYFMKEEQVKIILCPLGSPTLQASLDLLQTGALTVLFPMTGSPLFRSPQVPGVINLRVSYPNEVHALIPYVMDKYLVKNFAFFYQNDAYGISAMEASRKILKERGITNWLELPYTRNTTDFKDIIKKIQDAQPDALGLFSVSASTREILRQLGVEPLVGTQLFGLSFLVDDAFEKYIKQLGLNCVLAHTVPNPWTSDLPIVQEYRTVMDGNNTEYSAIALEAYIATSLLFDAMKNIKGAFTHETVRAYFEALKNYQYKGLELSFDPQTRELLHDVWLDTGAKKWIKNSVVEKAPNKETTH